MLCARRGREIDLDVTQGAGRKIGLAEKDRVTGSASFEHSTQGGLHIRRLLITPPVWSVMRRTSWSFVPASERETDSSQSGAEDTTIASTEADAAQRS